MENPMTKSRSKGLIFLCWLAYTGAYLGRLNYNANLIGIMAEFGVSKAEGGAVSSFFFFAYGAGQLFHGVLSSRYNPRLAISLALLGAAALNLAVPFAPFPWFKILWLLNGFVQAVLWSTLTRVLGRYLNDQALKVSVVAMGTSTAVGTALCYGGSALLARFADWRASFYLAAAALAAVAFIWFHFYEKLTAGAGVYDEKPRESRPSGGKRVPGLTLLIGVVLIFAVLNNLIKDGLTTWAPSVFKELFSMTESVSILLTIGLPLLSVFGSALCVALNRRLKDYVALIGVFYGTAFCAFLMMISLKFWWSMLICFSFSALMMTAVNNVVTSLMPLQMRSVVDCGKLAGTINAFCYIGSTISTYLLGAVADRSGWSAVFYLLLALLGAAMILCAAYLLFLKKRLTNRG